MNWLNLLKNRTGKLVMSTQKALIISAGVGIVGATLMQNLIMPSEEQPMQVRSLSSVTNDFDYGGMRQADDRTGLTSINVSDDSGALKTAQGVNAPDDFGLKGADNVGTKLSSSVQGVRADSFDSDGLGKSRDVDLSGDAGNNMAGNSRSSRVYLPRGSGNGEADGSSSSGARGSNRSSAQPTQIASLGSASMSRASGSSINASFGDSSSGSSSYGGGSRSGSSRSSNGKSGSSSYNFSGAMPGGTNPISLGGADGRGSSRFMAGGVRATVTGRAEQSGPLKNELKDISKRSADAARLAGQGDASNTEGALAFLNGNASQGVELLTDEAKDISGASSDDFDKVTTPQIKGIQKWKTDTDDYGKNKGKEFGKLLALLVGTLIALVVGMAAIAYFAEIGGWWGYALAGVVTAFVLAMMGNTFAFARQFYLDFGRDGWIPPVTWSLSAVVIGGLAFAWLSARSPAINKSDTAGKFWKNVGMKNNIVKEKSPGFLKSLFSKILEFGGNQAKNAIANSTNSDEVEDPKDNTNK